MSVFTGPVQFSEELIFLSNDHCGIEYSVILREKEQTDVAAAEAETEGAAVYFGSDAAK